MGGVDVQRLVGSAEQRSVESQQGNGERRCKMVALVILRATQIKTYSWGNAQVVLVGNKVDLEEERQVPTEDAQRLATELGQHAHTYAYTQQHVCLHIHHCEDSVTLLIPLPLILTAT